MSILNKISLRSTDYVAAINQSQEVVDELALSAKGLVCAEGSAAKYRKYVEKSSQLDESAFNKVVVEFGDLNLVNGAIYACDHLGFVLVTNIPVKNKKSLVHHINNMGIYEWWDFQDSKNSFDLFF